MTAARRVAFEILTLVGERQGHSDELLHSALVEALSPEDRNLTTALVMGVLRWQIALDARVKMLLQRPDQRIAEPVALALRMGAFQLLHMDRIPAHAALSESVELCKLANQPHAAGMVNAILRKIAAAQRPGKRLYESVPAFAERLGHPHWLVERWVAAYGREAAVAICEADQQEAAQRRPASGEMFAPEDDLLQMDEGSRLVAELAAAAMPEGGTRVWDCCAAPGGKPRVLAHRLPGAKVLATDVSGRRLRQMEERLGRFEDAGGIECRVADALALPGEERFDLILCDVPCSGTGTLGRNPEIRHQLRQEDFGRQAARQRALLGAAYKRLAPGGRLVYSTCSLEPEENERVIEGVEGIEGLARGRRVRIEDMVRSLAARGILSHGAADDLLRSGVQDGSLRTLPGVHAGDGFFAAVFERQLAR